MAIFLLVLVYHLKLKDFYCDYFYQSTGTHYSLHGRDSYGRRFCGCWIVSFNSDYSYKVWLIGASISFKPLLFIVIILIKVMVQINLFVVVVDQITVQLLVYFVLF